MVSACGDKTTRPDVSKVKVDVKIERFDKEIGLLHVSDIAKKNALWQQEYGSFYRDYMLYMLSAGDPQDTIGVKNVLPKILEQKDFLALNQAVAKKFPDLKLQEEGLTTSFKYLKYYFPEIKVPRFISFFSGFAVQTPIGDNYMGIGLDMFLGFDSEFYPALVKSIPMYMSRRFTPENIVPRVTESFIREEIFPQDELDATTLQHMLYQGKILYALDAVLPENTADSLKIGYTAKQMEWATHYESDIWSWFMHEDLLFNSDFLKIQKYFSEGPFTAELGEKHESAPKVGSFIGWMMVRKYMKQHPEIDLKTLFKNSNAQEILKESKYKGKSD